MTPDDLRHYAFMAHLAARIRRLSRERVRDDGPKEKWEVRR